MMTLAYISSEWLFDTDMTVLPLLAKRYNLIFVYTTNFTNPRTDIETVRKMASENHFRLELINGKYKRPDPRNLLLNRKITSIIIRYNVDIVYKVSTSLYWLLAAAKLKKPIVYGVHDVIAHPGSRWSNLYQKVADYTFSHNEFFALHSQYQYEIFKKRFPNKQPSLVGMSVKDFGYSNIKRTNIEDGVNILFFGRIEEYKGLDLLIDALESLYEEGIRNLHLNICGKGPFWDICNGKIKHSEIYTQNIRFIQNQEIPKLMMSNHFLCLPYRNSTQSGPLMIAANYALPIIAPKDGEFKNVYSDDSAILYEKGELKEALKKASKLSGKQYEALQKHCQTIKISYSPGNIVKRYESIFDKCIKQSQSI